MIAISVQYGGNVGLAITQATGLTGMLQWGIRQMAEMENQMTSVERVLEYAAIQSEPQLESAPGELRCLEPLMDGLERNHLLSCYVVVYFIALLVARGLLNDGMESV
jgi:hypothetical protein